MDDLNLTSQNNDSLDAAGSVGGGTNDGAAQQATQLTAEQKLIREMQSKIDKAEAELTKRKQFDPLIELATKKPELIDKVLMELEPQQKEVKASRPVPPQKPAGYNHAEAVTDPNSVSYKFREALDQYNYDMAVYQDRQMQAQEAYEMQMRQQQEASMRQRQVYSGIAKELKEKFGYQSDDEINDFFQKTAQPPIETLVEFHKYTKGNSKINERQRQLEMQKQKLGLSVLDIGGESAPVDEGEAFGKSLLAMRPKFTGIPEL